MADPARQATTESKTAPVTLRAVLFGLALSGILGVVTPFTDLRIQGTWIAASHLPMGPLFVLMLLTGLVGAASVRRGMGRLRITRAEMATVYILMLVGAGIPSFGLTEYLVPTLAGSNYFASAANKWAETFYRYIPRWLVPYSPHGAPQQPAMLSFYEGLRFGQSIPWRPWITPLLLWSLFAFTLFFCYLCLAAILRRQWIDNEKLPFPLAQLPIEMLREDGRPFLRNPLMWLGFAVPMIVHAFNGLHQYYPSVPSITLKLELNPYFTARPWNGMGLFWLWVLFSVIGFTYLLPLDLSFSLWFFFLLFKAQEVILSAMGNQPAYAGPYPVQVFAAQQMLGAFIVLFGSLIYLARPHLKHAWSEFWRPTSADRQEPMSFRVAIGGLAIGTLALSGMLAAAGMSFPLALAAILLLYFIAITLTRFVSESGLLFIQAPFRPSDLMAQVVGTSALGPANLTIFAFVQRIFMFDLRTFLLPSLLDGFRIADSRGLNRRSLARAMMLSVGIAAITSFASVLWIGYTYGGVNLQSWFAIGSPTGRFNELQSQIATPRPPTVGTFGWTALGVVIMVLLYALRLRYAGFLLHPMGYAMGPSWPMIQLWFSIFIGWLAKSALVRYGGTRAYVRARPFFLGLVLGEYSAAFLWLIVNGLTGVKGFSIGLT